MMGVSSRFQPFDKSVLFSAAEDLDAPGRSKALAEFARQEIAAIDAVNVAALGHPVTHVTFVDGSPAGQIDQVKPDGTVVAQWALTSDVVQWTWDKVKEFSPVLSGAFKNSQRIYADGVEVAGPDEAVGASEVVILSVVPYARKLEGNGARPPQSKKAPDGIYEAVAALSAGRYGNIASVKFSYRSPLGGAGALEAWASKSNQQPRRSMRPTHRADWLRRQPAIIITFR